MKENNFFIWLGSKIIIDKYFSVKCGILLVKLWKFAFLGKN